MTMNLDSIQQAIDDANEQEPNILRHATPESSVFVALTIDGKEQHYFITGVRVEQAVSGDGTDPIVFLKAVDPLTVLGP